MPVQVVSTIAGHVAQAGPAAGRTINPGVILKDTDTGSSAVVISLNGGRFCTVLDVSSYLALPPCTLYRGGPTDNPTYTFMHLADGTTTLLHSHLMSPTPDDFTVDHINQFKTDNRLRNLQLSSQAMQSANRGDRSDRHAPPPAVRAMGIERLPRYVRWDASEARFTILGAPGASAMKLRNGGNSTKSVKCSMDGQLLDICLIVRDYFVTLLARPDHSVNKDGERAAEYVQWVAAAHTHDPALFPAAPPVTDSWNLGVELRLAEELVERLRARGASVVAGAANGEYEDSIVELATGPCGVRTKAGTYTLYDLQHAAILKPFNWEASPMTNPNIIVPDASGRKEKMTLAHFVVTRCYGEVVDPATHVVVPINGHHYDVRRCNLKTVQGSFRNFKGKGKAKGDGKADGVALPADADAVALGIRYLPPGISVCGKDVTAKRRGVVPEGEEGAKRFSAGKRKTITACIQLAMSKMREWHPNFDAENAVFQARRAEYDSVAELL